MTCYPIDAAIAKGVTRLLSEVHDLLHDHDDLMRKAAVAMEAAERGGVLRLLDAAGERLDTMNRLADDLRDRAAADRTLTLAMQVETIREALSTTNAKYRRAVQQAQQRAHCLAL